MAILVITANLQCCRCRAKITKVLDCLKEEFCIEKVEFEDKNNKVVVRGKFDAEKLRKVVWCKAGKFVMEIAIVVVWPKPDPCKTEPCKHEHDPCKHEPCKHEHDPQPPPPKTEYRLLPYPYPYPLSYPVMCQSWPWQCPPQQQCHCCTELSPPPPPPLLPPPCKCSPHDHDHEHEGCECVCKPLPAPPCNSSCGATLPVWPPQPPVWPPQWGGCNIVTEENP
ncbi:protein PYRICULARIA ORYZAE RESISTANCE 21-like [Phragmites australis]|uniref:protein PYRICULARIA ORYZAE RESISTANCE 21-like n=1 Tax=Phragmites australis TaxID=29695 RepID=UPI002D7883BC|nr:protein PYRICULARIA ORYZAE RESISTANCE 21-like [Phragmites australis]